MSMNNHHHHHHHIDPSLFQNYTWINNSNNNIINNKNHNDNNNNNDLIGMAMEEHADLHNPYHIINPFATSRWSSFPLTQSLESRTLLSTTLFSDQDNNPNNVLHQQGDNLEGQEDGDDDQESEDELGPMKEMMYKIAAMQPVDIDPATVRKPKRRNVRISEDPQSVAARHRRERISEKIRILQRLVPGGTKMDTASMLDEAIRYVKFLKRQIRLLQSGGHPPPQPSIAASHGLTLPQPLPPSNSSYKNVVPGGGGFSSTSSAGFGGPGGGDFL